MRNPPRGIQGFPKYRVYPSGVVQSIVSGKWKTLRQAIGPNGYPTVCLGRGNTRTVHSLVAEAFIGPRPHGQEILHRDGRRDNPTLRNLRYGTKSENCRDRISHGTNGKKLTPEHVKEIRSSRGRSQAQLAKLYGVHPSTISNILLRKHWKAL